MEELKILILSKYLKNEIIEFFGIVIFLYLV
jgi:hypothetical protein